MAITEPIRQAILTAKAHGTWAPALDSDGEPRDGAEVCELTGLVPDDGYPPGTRYFVRRERPHPGAQLSLFDTIEGLRHRVSLSIIVLDLVSALSAESLGRFSEGPTGVFSPIVPAVWTAPVEANTTSADEPHRQILAASLQRLNLPAAGRPLLAPLCVKSQFWSPDGLCERAWSARLYVGLGVSGPSCGWRRLGRVACARARVGGVVVAGRRLGAEPGQ